jgi:hypothetical protein
MQTFDRWGIIHEISRPAFAAGCQSSSGVEQRTHKPLVGGSNPSSGTNFQIYEVPSFFHPPLDNRTNFITQQNPNLHMVLAPSHSSL